VSSSRPRGGGDARAAAGVFERADQAESLILAQDERWRRA
jgi:hypothetical protein